MIIRGFDNLIKIGEGGMATVWKAKQKSLDRTVAIKILRSSISARAKEMHAFIEDARSISKIKHPNIIQIYDVAEVERVYYVVMEYIDGPTVQQIIEREKRLPQQKALKIALGVASALQAAWEAAKIVHRDIKPANIMIDKDGVVKLSDLGLPKMADPFSLSAQIASGEIETIPNYMSPEQAKCAITVNYTTDMYSLGATLYHMVTGKAPFMEYAPQQVIQMIESKQITNPKDIVPSLPKGLVQLIARLMTIKSEDRYKDWADAIEDIKKTIAGRIIVLKSASDSASVIASSKFKAPAPTTTYAEKKKTEPQAPLWIQLPAWTILVLWLVFLAMWIIKQPQETAQPPPASASPAESAQKKPESEEIKQKTGQAKPEKQKVPPPAKNAAGAQTAEETAKPPESATASPNGVSAENTASDSEINQAAYIKKNAGNILFGENYDKAIELIKNELEYSHTEYFKNEMNAAKNFIEDVSKVNAGLIAGLQNKAGKDIAILFKGKRVQFKITNVAGDNISGNMETKKGETVIIQPISLSFYDLAPSDRIQWLAKANDPAACAIKCILSCKMKKYNEAIAYAKNCGPFADTFIQIIQSLGGG